MHHAHLLVILPLRFLIDHMHCKMPKSLWSEETSCRSSNQLRFLLAFDRDMGAINTPSYL